MNRLTRYHALAFMVLSLLVAAVLRFPDLSTLPPGVHYDEAANGVLAGEIGLQGERPVFIPSYTGKEALFFYLAGGMARAVGNSVFSLRLTAAYVALLTIAATYWLGRELLADRRIALLAVALLTISFWHIVFSRLGFRAITQPLLQALAVAALWRGLRRGRWPWFWLAGVFLGLTAYTYLAARVFPFLVFFAALPLLFDRATFRVRWQQLLFTALVALLVVLPLLGYFAAYPDTFWTRIGQVAPSGGGMGLTESLLRSFGMFFLVGDPYVRFNIPGRPLFDFVTGGLLIVGWIIGALRYRRLPYDWQRSAVLLLLLAPLVMILPTALAVNEIVPSNLRAMGLIPFIFYLPAIGLIALLIDIERRFQRPNVTYAVQFILLLLLIAGGFYVHDLYFHSWGRESRLILETDGDLTAAAAWLDDTLAGVLPEDRPAVYVAAQHFRHPTLAFLSDNYESVRWLPQSRALVFPASGETLYIYPANSPAPDWAARYLASGDATVVSTPGGGELLTVYRLDQPPAAQPAEPVGAHFSGLITLDGYDTGEAVDETLPLTLFWQVNQPLPGDSASSPAVFVHLEDATGYRWSQQDVDAYPAGQWQGGETVIQRVDVPLPAGLPPGDYRLRVGLFDQANGARLPRLDDNGRYAGDSALLEPVAIPARSLPDRQPQAPVRLNDDVVDGLRLLGYEPGAQEAQSGQSGRLALWWWAESPLPPLSLRLSLTAADGQSHTLVEGRPVYDTLPFEAWPPSAFIIDRQTYRLPDELDSGDYHFELAVLDAAGEPVYTADLGPVTVTQTERLFTRPPVEHETDALFGEDIRLAGYSLAGSDERRVLELVWQAVQAPAADYTVFIHALNPDGTCCAWQQDAMPQQNEYPTGRWQPGEYVVDSYTIELPPGSPPGDYPLEIGLYLAETAQRLPVTVDGEPAGDALLLSPISLP